LLSICSQTCSPGTVRYSIDGLVNLTCQYAAMLDIRRTRGIDPRQCGTHVGIQTLPALKVQDDRDGLPVVIFSARPVRSYVGLGGHFPGCVLFNANRAGATRCARSIHSPVRAPHAVNGRWHASHGTRTGIQWLSPFDGARRAGKSPHRHLQAPSRWRAAPCLATG
jgi:hypothetical protein